MPLIKLSISCQVQYKHRYPELFHFSVSHAVGVRNTAVYLPCVAAFRNVSMSVTYLPNIHKAVCIARSKRDGTRAETRFGLSAKRMSPFKSAGVSVQSTTGSRGVRISGQKLYRPCSDVQCKAAGYPLHSHLFPSLPLRASPCAIMFRTRYTNPGVSQNAPYSGYCVWPSGAWYCPHSFSCHSGLLTVAREMVLCSYHK